MSLPWERARALAAAAAPNEPVTVIATDAIGLVLAADLVASADLPPYAVSAMDGWAVAGEPPWQVVGELRAGEVSLQPLVPGTAMQVSTGAGVPTGTVAVLRSELGLDVDGTVHLRDGASPPRHGRDIRAAGSECHAGDVVAAAGLVVVPALVGLAAAVRRRGADRRTASHRRPPGDGRRARGR